MAPSYTAIRTCKQSKPDHIPSVVSVELHMIKTAGGPIFPMIVNWCKPLFLLMFQKSIYHHPKRNTGTMRLCRKTSKTKRFVCGAWKITFKSRQKTLDRKNRGPTVAPIWEPPTFWMPPFFLRGMARNFQKTNGLSVEMPKRRWGVQLTVQVLIPPWGFVYFLGFWYVFLVQMGMPFLCKNIQTKGIAHGTPGMDMVKHSKGVAANHLC